MSGISDDIVMSFRVLAAVIPRVQNGCPKIPYEIMTHAPHNGNPQMSSFSLIAQQTRRSFIDVSVLLFIPEYSLTPQPQILGPLPHGLSLLKKSMFILSHFIRLQNVLS
jgi:hypothetical protein